MGHSTPITFPEDETFHIGSDTRTPLALVEHRDVPFEFSGTIDKLTFDLGREQLTAEGARRCTRPSPRHAMSVDLGPEQSTDEEHERVPAIAGPVACSKDRGYPAR